MPINLELWTAIAANLTAVLVALLRLERRITRIETDVRWLMHRRRDDRAVHNNESEH